ncbi:MAG TPA: DUF2703 domain-containing protein [Methanolinea sp.]|jgi:hypothetical protein|nr:DUF2703 domain-containing protein [Methanolinea sp.]HOS82874.1 DUF2703 domain-containing protein [Methanolinea sp.]HPC55997.1 DUF2703 domain-containing protein [Methanolinea sp.]HQE86508.1 DUF2703 domain-containing protein [Methanolinea sp.]HQI15229.1 DUF2703 domain-containing protein [Methanolinea sp.]
MAKTLVIEWKHIGNDVTGTCERCSLTGGAIRDVLKDLGPYFRQKGIIPEFRETVLPDAEIGVSNQVLLDGRPLEDFLAGAEVVSTPCCSCACITGQDEAYCRAIEYRGHRYEAITPDLLKQVIIGVVESKKGTCDCGCACNGRS